MINIENEILPSGEQIKTIINGMRNPLNSWNRFDTDCNKDNIANIKIGENDYNLMTKLVKAGTDHRKFLRMMVVYMDITAPLYWWKEFDTYKVGTVSNSCSTMHKIHSKEFVLEDFSYDYLVGGNKEILSMIVARLNELREIYIDYDKNPNMYNKETYPNKKVVWQQMIQLLPSSYNQKRTVMLNYEVLSNMYHSRKNHKLDEWRIFCNFVEYLPYSDLITS